ncbi:MAG: PKD domain-containing protein, partial [Flavobacteriales bacterium]
TPSVTNETCVGNSDGTATVTVGVGLAPFTYLWSTGAITQSITAGAGEYHVVVSDANGCTSRTDTAVIGSNATNTADAGLDLTGCFTSLPVSLHGSVSNAPSGIWSGGAGTFVGTGLNVTYMPSPAEIAANGVDLILTTTATGGCPPDQDTMHLTLSTSFFGSNLAGTNASCFGITGTIVYTPNLPGSSYLWNDPAAQTTATASGLVAANYTVHVTDSLGCDTTLQKSITQPNAITITSLTMLPEQCTGSADGTITAQPAGGTLPYHYSWSNGDTTAMITVGAGTYTVSVTDANGCTPATGSATVTTVALPNIADAGLDLTGCFAHLPVPLHGTITHATGGVWSGGSGSFSGTGLNVNYTPTPAEIAAHGVDLFLTTTGNNSCPSDQDTVHLTLSNSFFGSTLTRTNASCFGSTGTIVFTPDLPGSSYQWNDPAAQTTATASGLVAGNYTVHVTDSLGCDTTLQKSITQPNAITITSLTMLPEQCTGSGNGSITAHPAGGTLPYHYSWSNGDTTAMISVGAGTYSVSVTDANGCAPGTASTTVTTIGQTNIANAGPDVIGCFAHLPVHLNGTVTNATGGVWSGGNGTFSNTGLQPTYMPTPAEILANSVDLVLTTTGNTTCPEASDIIHITLPTSFFGSALSTSMLACNGDHSGSASFTPNNSSLTYLWNDASAQATATASSLSAGTYSVHVTDSYGCDTTASVVITEPTALSAITITPTPPTCSGNGNGSASVQLTGGTPGYSYQWSTNANGQTTSTAFGLPAGAFTVVVTDANGCHAQATTTLTAPPPITLTAQVEDTVCVNTPVPLTAQASGGAGGYTITWTGIGTGSMLQYSFPASHVVQVSVVDQNGCSGPMLELPVTVLDLSLATLHTYGDTAFCPGGTATVGAWVTGYPGSTSLSWPQLPATGNGPFTVPATASRNLTVTATDGCSNTLQGIVPITVEIPPAVTLPTVIAEGCEPLTVHFPTGLTNQPVSYLWNFGDGTTSTSMSPVHVYHAGNYTVSLTVTTPLGCAADALNTGAVHAYTNPVAAFTADPWEVDADHADIQFIDQSTGSISTWDWSFGDGGISIDPDPAYHYLEPGTWQVSLHVTDDHGCTSSVDHIVKVNPVYDITIPNAFTPNPHGGSGGGFNPMDLSNDVFYPFIRFVKDFRMRVFNRWGELVFESNDIERGWDGYYKGHISQQDVYIYQVWVRFVDNKEVQRTGDITLFR